MLLAIRVLLYYELTHIKLGILLLFSPNFHDQIIISKPFNRCFAPKLVSMVFTAFTSQLRVYVGYFLLLFLLFFHFVLCCWGCSLFVSFEQVTESLKNSGGACGGFNCLL